MPIPPDVKRLWYGWDWQTKIRPAALERARYRCQRCFRLAPLDVAHLDGNPANRDGSNLAALCRTCHRANDYKLWAQRCRETRSRRKDRNRPLLCVS